MRQMDVVSGLINVLTGLCFSGRSNEGVHKKWAGYLFCLQNRCYTCLVSSFHHSLYSWMIQPSMPDMKVTQALFPYQNSQMNLRQVKTYACINSSWNIMENCNKMEKKNTVKAKVKLIYKAFQQTSLSALQNNKWHKQWLKLCRLHMWF